MKRIATCVTLLSLLLLAAPASAKHMNVTDRNDTDGLMDVRRVATAGGTYAKWKVATFKKWSRQQLWDQGYIAIYLDTFGTKRHDYYALASADKQRFRATLFRDRANNTDYAVRSLRISRPNRKSVRVVVNLDQLKIGDNRATYNWYVQTLWTGKGCARVCFDWAPDIGKDGGGIEEPLPLSL